MSTHLTPFKTIWPDFCVVYPVDFSQDHLSYFIILYPIDYFEYHITSFLYCVPNWLLSRPFGPILSLHTQLTPFKTIWPNFISVPIWLLSRPYDLNFTEKHCAFHWKAKKHLIQHRSLIMTWCFIEYRGNANYVYIIFWWYLVVHVCVNGACIHTYWPGFVCFHEKWHFSLKVHEKHWKAPEK